jgi:hypothetical protein
MNAFRRLSLLVFDPVFWVTTILCGLLLGIIANYLTRFVDRLLVSVSAKRQAKAEATNASILAEAKRLLEHPDERFDLKLDVLFFGARVIRFYVTSLLLVLLSLALQGKPSRGSKVMSLVLLVLALLGWTLSTVYHNRERRALRIISAYARLKNHEDVQQ